MLRPLTGNSRQQLTHPHVKHYVIVSVALFAVFVGLRDLDWAGDAPQHTLMMAVAALLACIIGMIVLTRYYSHKDKIYLLLGCGFLGAGLLDGFNAVATSGWVVALPVSALSTLIPWSWNASRILLAVFIFLSWWGWRREQCLGPAVCIPGEHMICLVLGGITLSSFMLFTLATLSPAYFPDVVFGRPGEFLATILFLSALGGYCLKGAWRTDLFEHWLVLSLIVCAFSHSLFMAFSATLFDTCFIIAHILKTISYVCALIGLFFSMHHLFEEAAHARIELANLHASLRTEIDQREQTQACLQHFNEQLDIGIAATNKALSAAHETLQDEFEKQVRMVTALKNNRRKFERFFENLPIAVVEVQSDGMVRRVNRQFESLFHYDRSEIIGKRITLVIPNSGHDMSACDHLEDLDVEPPDPQPGRLGRRRNGNIFPIRVVANTVRNTNDDYDIMTVTDISEIMELESKLTHWQWN